MKKIRNIVIGGIQQKIFNLALIAILLVVGVFAAVSAWQMTHFRTPVSETRDYQQQAIAEVSRKTMDAVLSSTMVTDTQMQAYMVNDLFRDLGDNVRMLADYAAVVLSTPDDYTPQEVHIPDASAEGGICLQLLTEEGVDLADPALARQIGLAGNLSGIMRAIYANGRISSCYVALPDGVMILVDSHPASKLTEDGTPIPIPIRERPWYTGAVESGGLYFTDVTEDVFTGQIGTMCSMPVIVDGELLAVVGADLFLDGMAEAIAATGEDGGFVFLVNENGHVVFSPKTEGSFRVLPAEEAEDLRSAENGELAAFLRSAARQETEVCLVEADDTLYYMTGAPVETVGWTVVNAVSKELTEQPMLLMEQQNDSILNQAGDTFRSGLSRTKQTTLCLLLAVLVLSITGALVLAKRIVKPLESMTARVRSLGGEDLQFRMEDTFRTGDEIEVLAESFAMLSAKTLRYIDQVKTVTAEKERIASELDMARAIQASQVPRLFPAFPDRPEFDIYATMTPAKEVGGDFYDFFLIDRDHIALVMADVSGKGVPAALFMMVSRVLIKSRVQNGETPAQALANVNNQLCEGNDAGFFITSWLGIVEISTGKGVAANAGHEHPALCRAGGSYELVTYRHSPVVGAMEGLGYREHEFTLYPGDRLFVYTDGVPEATNAEQELFGTDRMLAALNRSPQADPKETLANVMDDISGFVADAPQFDDITMLCLEYFGPEASAKPVPGFEESTGQSKEAETDE